MSKEKVKEAPNIEPRGEELSQDDERALYHYYALNYTPPATESGRGLPAADRRYRARFGHRSPLVAGLQAGAGTPATGEGIQLTLAPTEGSV